MEKIIVWGILITIIILLINNGQIERDADEAMKKIFGKDYKRK